MDAFRFEQLCAEARASDAAQARAAKLREALELWRGPALGDLVYEPFAAVEIGRLEELRLAATQDLIDAELELGRDADLVPELEALIEEHPLRRATARPADARALPQRPPGRGARGLPDGASRPGRGARPRARPAAPRAGAGDPAARRVAPGHGAGPGAALAPDGHRARRRPPRAPQIAIPRRSPSSSPRCASPSTGTAERRDCSPATRRWPCSARRGCTRTTRCARVRAAAELRAALPELRIGVATGEVFAGDEGVAGAPVTLARQLELVARAGEVLVGAPTLRLVRDAVRGQQVTRGALAAFELGDVIEGAPGIARRLDRPLVDREAELEELRQAFATARDERRCVVFTGFGEAGIGKTRLAREFLAQVRDEATVLVGRCASYGQGVTFLPLREMIDGFDDMVESAGSTGEIFLAARQRFEELAEERPLLLVFEDVHWAEPTLLDLIEYLGSQASDSPILALCLSRPDLLADRAGWEEVGPSLVLEPLTDEHARVLAGDEPHRDRIVEIAEGNPLYVEQLVASVEEAGPEALETVPGSVEALLASRLDRLGPAERAVAQRAAVVGRRFAPAAVAALGPTDALPTLENVGFVHRAGRLYRFHHVLVRDVVYAGTPKAERAELHRRHAEWLADRPDGTDELVGYHLEQAAGLPRRAGRTGRRGRGARRRRGPPAGRRRNQGLEAGRRDDRGQPARPRRRAASGPRPRPPRADVRARRRAQGCGGVRARRAGVYGSAGRGGCGRRAAARATRRPRQAQLPAVRRPACPGGRAARPCTCSDPGARGGRRRSRAWAGLAVRGPHRGPVSLPLCRLRAGREESARPLPKGRLAVRSLPRHALLGALRTARRRSRRRFRPAWISWATPT